MDDDPRLAEMYATILQESGMITLTLNDPLQALAGSRRSRVWRVRNAVQAGAPGAFHGKKDGPQSGGCRGN